mgnify:CR=1 FL=1
MILGVIQARMKSSRLPGKVLKPMAGLPMLTHVIKRALACRMIDRMVIITSEEPEDHEIVKLGSHFMQVVTTHKLLPDGSNDVLAWFAHAVEVYPNTNHLVRITGDCPLWCPLLGAEVIAHHLAHGRYYTTNVTREVDGFDVEVFTREALNDAHHAATECYDRHHVTPWIRRNRPFHFIDHRELVGGAKLSVDTQADFDRCLDIAEELHRYSKPVNNMTVMDVFDMKGYERCSDIPSHSPTSNGPS